VFDEIARVEFLLQSLKSFNLFENLTCEPVDLKRFLLDLRPLVTQDLVEGAADVVVDLPEASVWATIDPRGLHQVLLNLLSNSRDALHDRPAPRITLALRREGRFACLAVDDNGVGLSPTQLNLIFKPFYSNKHHGTGLGMAIVRKLVAKMGGTIEVKSERGVGTRIDLHLPGAHAP